VTYKTASTKLVASIHFHHVTFCASSIESLAINVTLQYRNSLPRPRPYDLSKMIFDRSASEVNRKYRKSDPVKMETHVIQSKFKGK
jgi:hypothetical protein